jgi:uncharacterized membrane protein
VSAVRRGTLHRLFHAGILLKGVDGALEMVGGLLLLVVQPEALSAIVRFLTAHELSEDPSDRIANLLRQAVQHLSANTQAFAGVYLVAHGLIKVLLVAGLLRGKHWAYPTALWFLGAFVLYQLYRLALTHALGLGILTVFDGGIMYLIWREYRRLRHGAFEREGGP